MKLFYSHVLLAKPLKLFLRVSNGYYRRAAFLLFSLASALTSIGQVDTVASSPSPLVDSIVSPQDKKSSKKTYPRTVVKMNVTSLFFNNYNFTVERALTRKISGSVGFRFMPSTSIGSIKAGRKLAELVGEDIEELTWNHLLLSNKALTAEVRFYGGRKPGPRGFYFGLYGRYADFDVKYDYTYEGNSGDYLIPVRADLKGFGGGITFGVQWLIGKRVALDWHILGGHWGKLNGRGNGNADLSTMSQQEKQDLQREIEDFLPYRGNKKTVSGEVNDNGIKATASGPFAGLKTGISLGISF